MHQKQNRVPVMDSRKIPLMPCTQVRARLLLKRGKAKPYWNKLGVFCIILTKEVEPNNQKIAIGIDPGSKFEGWSVVGTKDTVLNGMSEATTHVKDAVEVRRNMRKARRRRKLWRRPARFNNRCRNKKALPPSTKARWQTKLRILNQLKKIIPISVVVIEDVCAVAKKGCKRWNTNFSPIEHGKQWFYEETKKLGIKLHLKQGYETKELREKFGLKKTSQKDKKTFNSHAVDAWVMAASVSGASRPSWLGLFYWVPIRFHRRQLHYLQPSKGGVRKPYGGTRSMGLSRGTLVRHIKYGLTYIGGTSKDRVSLHGMTGKRLTQYIKVSDLKILTVIRFRSQPLNNIKTEISTAGE